jgi:dihydroflavonol-4-reductase
VSHEDTGKSRTSRRPEPVLVAGASGFVGSHTARHLVNEGRTVRVLLRKTSRREAMDGLPVEIFLGDVLEPASLRAAMKGCSTVFYSVVDPRFWLTDTTPLFRNNVEGLVNAMDTALECGIKRFVFTSTMGTLGRNPTGAVTEETEFNWLEKAPPYIRSRRDAESRFFEYCRDKGLPGVALCIANTYGPDDYQPTPQGKMLSEVANGRVKVVWNAAQPTVDIRDVAQAALLAENCGRVGERYIIANEFLSYRRLFGLAAAEGGYKPPMVAPLGAAYAAAWAGEHVLKLLRRKDYLVRSDAVFLSIAFGELDSTKARRELHWRPRPIAETVRDAVAWFANREKVAHVGLSPILGHW